MLMAAVVALWSVTCGSILYIRGLYDQRGKDKDSAIEKLENRITKLEADKEEMLKTRERQMSLMEESVASQRKQAEVMEAMYEKVTGSQPRRRTSGD
jgi:hypothetical protein